MQLKFKKSRQNWKSHAPKDQNQLNYNQTKKPPPKMHTKPTKQNNQNAKFLMAVAHLKIWKLSENCKN